MAGSLAFRAGFQAGAYRAVGFLEVGRWVACFLEVERQAGVDPEVGRQAVGFQEVAYQAGVDPGAGQSADGLLAVDLAEAANRVAGPQEADRPEAASNCTARLEWPMPRQNQLW
jgi:hypothetical protein